jgi:hypothetical protein
MVELVSIDELGTIDEAAGIDELGSIDEVAGTEELCSIDEVAGIKELADGDAEAEADGDGDGDGDGEGDGDVEACFELLSIEVPDTLMLIALERSLQLPNNGWQPFPQYALLEPQ